MDPLIAGLLVSLSVQGAKFINSKTQNAEVTKAAILGLVALFSLVGAFVWQHAPREILETWIKTILIAVGFFETVYKLVIAPAISKAGNAIIK